MLQKLKQENLDFSNAVAAADSANAVRSCTVTYSNGKTEKTAEGYYKPISDKYPEELAINEILMLIYYQLVLGKKAIRKIPVFDENNKLIGVFSKAIPDFKDMSDSTLTAEELLDAGFIETLWACYFRMENDLHPKNITVNAQIFDADKSNYPYIVKLLGQRYAESAFKYFYGVPDFQITAQLIRVFCDVTLAHTSGPCFWPTFKVPVNLNYRKTYLNIDAFKNLAILPEAKDKLYKTITYELLIVKDLLSAFKANTGDLFGKAADEYYKIFSERTHELKNAIISDKELLKDITKFMHENKNNLSQLYPNVSEQVRLPRYQKLLFELHSVKISKHTKSLSAISASVQDKKLSEKIEKIKLRLIQKLAQYLQADCKGSALCLINEELDQLKNITKDSEQVKAFEHKFKKLLKRVDLSGHEHNDALNSLAPCEFFWMQRPSTPEQSSTKNASAKPHNLTEAIAEAFCVFMTQNEDQTFPNRLDMLITIQKAYASYKNRTAAYINVREDTLSDQIASHIQTKPILTLFINDIAKNSFNWGYFSGSFNNYIFIEIFNFIKADLRNLDAISLAAEYPMLSYFTQEQIESFDIATNAEDVFKHIQQFANKVNEKQLTEDDFEQVFETKMASCAM